MTGGWCKRHSSQGEPTTYSITPIIYTPITNIKLELDDTKQAAIQLIYIYIYELEGLNYSPSSEMQLS